MEENPTFPAAGHGAPVGGHDHTGHEETDAPIRPVVLIGGVIALTAAMAFAICIGVFRYFSQRPVEAPPNPMAVEAPVYPPSPRIEEHPALEYQQMLVQEDQTLSTYGWVDRKAGTVRVPIDRAMDLLLQRGFSVRKEVPQK
jgi:hypothetical protein